VCENVFEVKCVGKFYKVSWLRTVTHFRICTVIFVVVVVVVVIIIIIIIIKIIINCS